MLRRVRIGIDAYITSPGQGGFTSFIRRVAEGLAAYGDEVIAYAPSVGIDTDPANLQQLPGVRVRPVTFDRAGYPNRTERDLDWHQRAWPEALAEDEPEVIFGSSYFLPLSWTGPSVTTIHDVIFDQYPEYYLPANRALYSDWGLRAARHADVVVAPSQATADHIRDRWDLDTPVVVARLASALPFVPDSAEQSRTIVSTQLGLNDPYLLSVAPMHPRKNLPGILAAYSALPDTLRRSHRLLLLNSDGQRVHELVADHGLTDQVLITGLQPAQLVPHIYRAAAVVLCPSFAEGFGLPALEGMASGVPVVSSTRPSLPEVVGDTGLLVDPHDPSAIAAALERVLTDPDLADDLARRGQERATSFSWSQTCSAIRGALQQAIAAQVPREKFP
jgi:glycosyltransferase involved in cell wall biosynthesis